MRRLTACKKLGWEKMPVRVVDLDALYAEHDKNVCRKDFTPTEAVSIGRALGKQEGPKAKARQEATRAKKGDKLRTGETPSRNGAENFTAPSEKGYTRDKVAAAEGMSGPTYGKAKAVVEAAEEDPEAYGDLTAKMDKSGKVEP